MQKTWIGCVLVCCCAGAAHSEDTLLLSYYERAPFAVRQADGSVAGLTADPAAAAFKRSGIAFAWQLVPAKRQIINMAHAKTPECALGWYQTAERSQVGKFTDPIYHDKPTVGIARFGFQPPGTTLAALAANPAIPAPVYAQALVQLRAGFGATLAHAGVADTGHFDPVTSDMQADGRGVNAVLAVLNHTRGYDNASGEASGAILTDTAWRPIAPPFGPTANEALDLQRVERERTAIQGPRVRIFIVGDSTAATYERQRLPRMGWGQVFETEFQDGAGVKVVNGARAGRSSRDFFNGGWYHQMLRYLQPGDYVVIAHGHNDQNCNAARALRGAADVANLCTYPNDAAGQRQFPPGQPHLSFQASLEVYVHDARARGAIPVLLTPTTRFLNSERKVAYTLGDLRPVVSQHVTRQNGAAGYAFTGDYSQTVRDTARANGVPLIDLEAKTIRFANTHAHDWKDYWLVVSDTVKFPWYATQTAGTANAPDTTHFQENGARAVAALVAQGIKETPPLRALAQHLR